RGNSDEIERQDMISKGSAQEDIHFEECSVGRDLERPYKN
ncbi:3895_t:CDS:1, partial [Funneliformis geosporum]